MLKYLTGTALGAAIAFVFVAFDLEPPAIIKAPAKLHANLVVSAVEHDLYDLGADMDRRERAFEIYLKNRPRDAVKLDAEAGHPLLNSLVRARARNEALHLLAQWSAYDEVLSQAALRAELERKYSVTDTERLKRAILFDALDSKPVLKSWLKRSAVTATPENSLALLQQAARPLSQPGL